MREIKNATTNPPFKWTGGKNRMREQYREIFFPDGEIDTFVDMFCGACSVSLWVAENFPNTKIVLNDNNKELIELYRVFQDDYDGLEARYIENVKHFLSFQNSNKISAKDLKEYIHSDVTEKEIQDMISERKSLRKEIKDLDKKRKKNVITDEEKTSLSFKRKRDNEIKEVLGSFEIPWKHVDTLPKIGDKVQYLDRKNFYYSLRDRYAHHWQTQSRAENAGDLLFMMRINFNGIWKGYEICNGRYSTPPGTLTQKEKFFDVEHIRKFKKFLDKCEIRSEDFGELTEYQTGGTYYYADPPYRDSVVVYDGEFSENDQKRLVNFLKQCDNKGCWVSESNKEIGDSFWTNNFGDSYYIHEVSAKYTAGRGTSTHDVTEVLVTNFLNTQGVNKELACG